MGIRQPPGNPYPPAPHVLDFAARVEQALRFVIDTVDAQGGEGIFIGYGRQAKRLMGKVCAILPAGYQGEITTLDTAGGSPSALARKARHETRLRVIRTGANVCKPTFEHPHQQALDALNRRPPQEDHPPTR